ncbi:hypothetical protein HanLR1_Chr01g0013631 [Helianthus annuus]|nr:hypothetical protein HanLR1_Chr01g0013631 [Helianthus annuus]
MILVMLSFRITRDGVDNGTSDYFALDVLLNRLTVLSSEYLGIQQVVFGGRSICDWEEGMKNPEDGYKYFKIVALTTFVYGKLESESEVRSDQGKIVDL